MKKLLFLLIAMFTLTIVVDAQTTKKPAITDYLTQEQLLQFENDKRMADMTKKMEQYGKWVGVGGEVGGVVKEALNAVVDVTDKFSKTNVGEFTLLMVAWKVMGKDLIRILLGIVFFIIMVITLRRIYINGFIDKRVMTENPGLFKYPKVYELIEHDADWDGYEFVKFGLMPVLFAGSVGLTYAIMFG